MTNNIIEEKVCSICNEEKELNEYYSQNKRKVDGTEYVYYQPYCKECNKKKSYSWIINNKERYEINRHNHMGTDKFKKTEEERRNRDYVKDYRTSWRRNNKDKLPKYRENHQNHDITDEEWYACLDYFNKSCAYCELSESEQYRLYNEQFHREHVIHDGNNYIDNCVPACTKCNTSKHNSEFNDWYNDENEVFTKRRLNKIINWMTKECFKVLNLD